MTILEYASAGAQNPVSARGEQGLPASLAGWRQAMEQAQARDWLDGRDLTPGDERQGRADPYAARTLVAPAGPARPADTAGQAGERRDMPAALRPEGDPTVPARIADGRGDVELRPTYAGGPGVAATPLSTRPGAVSPTFAEPATAAGWAGAAQARRPRKRSVHAQHDEQGVSVWIRDAAMNSLQARHLAMAIAESMQGGARDLASLYLNGRPLPGGPDSPSTATPE